MRKSTSRATSTETNVRIALLVISVIVNDDLKKSMMCVCTVHHLRVATLELYIFGKLN